MEIPLGPKGQDTRSPDSGHLESRYSVLNQPEAKHSGHSPYSGINPTPNFLKFTSPLLNLQAVQAPPRPPPQTLGNSPYILYILVFREPSQDLLKVNKILS